MRNKVEHCWKQRRPIGADVVAVAHFICLLEKGRGVNGSYHSNRNWSFCNLPFVRHCVDCIWLYFKGEENILINHCKFLSSLQMLICLMVPTLWIFDFPFGKGTWRADSQTLIQTGTGHSVIYHLCASVDCIVWFYFTGEENIFINHCRFLSSLQMLICLMAHIWWIFNISFNWVF